MGQQNSKRRWFSSLFRYPRTTQEKRANQDKNDPLVRNKRRRLPDAYDDIFICKQKSWKSLGRRKQYREDKSGYEWRIHNYNWRISEENMIARNIMDRLEILGCHWERTAKGIKWFGPEIL